MLEKIGLPPKPSLRGNNWVVDATHCQGCSSQFTFINRKHHCRRCGGIFCGSCTQQRMVLRGQGDSPVRICEPCKKLEEAARFEMRYGHKNRSGRGGTKLTTKHEDEVINKILGSEGTSVESSGSASSINILSSDRQATNRVSSSSFQEVSSHDDKGDIRRSQSHDLGLDFLTEAGTVSAEELHQQALEEKKKYRTLKAEGKPEEALRAFKKGKELEKQAGALEMQLRKNRRKTLSSRHASEHSSITDESQASARDNKLPTVKSKAKDDLSAELRELGWSDMDLRDADKKPAALSLEGELSTLIGEVSQRTNTGKGNHGIDKSQIIVHKRKALELKREGNLTEAKEELKKAKVLEKQIEEQELLGDDEDSDEEFSSLLRSLNDDKHDDLTFDHDLDRGFDFDPLVGVSDDISADANLEVTEEDMDDPEIASALKSLGWNEETTHSEDPESQFATPDTEALLNEIQSLKKEALDQKRAGNTAEALALLKKAKLLEKGLHSSDSQEPSNVNKFEIRNVNKRTPNMTSKSKLTIQKELLSLKKRALALRREGKLDEAEEELKKGKVLEKQLEEMDNPPKVTYSRNKQVGSTMISDGGDEEEVTDQDMIDPTYLSLLRNMGWEEDNNENVPSISSKADESVIAHSNDLTATQATGNIQDSVPRKSKGEIQRELLGLKRKSLALRRQGEAEEAEEVLKLTKVLEAQLEEIEDPLQKEVPANSNEFNDFLKSAHQNANSSLHLDSKQSPIKDLGSTGLVTLEGLEKIVGANEKLNTHILKPLQENVPQSDVGSLQQDILAHKRRAVVLKREGKLAEAKEELRQAKLLEKHMEEENSQASTSATDFSSSDVSSVLKKEPSPNSGPKTLSSRDRFKLQQESLNHKRQALKLRREGRTEEADAEFELAKTLESQLEESALHDSARSSEKAAEPLGEVTVEDFLDPQLLSALKAIGLQDASSRSQVLEISEPKEHTSSKIDKSSQEIMQLEEQIKSEKLKALNLKRSGKQAEALDALRRAKAFEKKLNSLRP